ncbi:MAG: antibiotic biosynthesis monooxygenase [Acidimicrobiia bacterium]|nr:antibiotic biosynthesis monooxygenase [Acidimicrobiia bacterium]
MMTVVTHATLREGAEPEWDAAMRQRLMSVQGRAGFVRSQLLIPLDEPNGRVIIGTWLSRADWEAWHGDEAFCETRQRLDGLQEAPSETTWYEIITDYAPPGITQVAEKVVDRGRETARSIVGRLRGQQQA